MTFEEWWADWRKEVGAADEVADEIEWTTAVMAWNAALEAVAQIPLRKLKMADLERLEDWSDYEPLKNQ